MCGAARVLELPYPHKSLWPNGRAHWGAKSRETRKHRQWAYAATLADNTRPAVPRRLIATFHGKPSGPLPDEDNASASLKAYQDGIADAYGVDDSAFRQPKVLFGGRSKHGSVTIIITEE